ncbi:MAG: signal peptidase II [Acidobacteria bacterium 13_2_20CM_57_17]|nr:MAG: signal peptidase II [Acidobacteria bacterium 13_2_20CM_57_17]
MTLASRLRFLWLTLAVVFLDRASKAWIESRPSDHSPHLVIQNFFYLVDSRNPGIAFSFLAGLSSPALRVFLICGSLIIIAVIAWLLVAGRGICSLHAAGLALLLGGATGNVTDRILHGAVTDFIEVYLHFLPWRIFNPWPAFNVADSAITIGAILILIDVLFGRRSDTPHSSS